MTYRHATICLPGTRAPRGSGFTLVELVVASAITVMIMAGLASAMLLATYALPDGQNPADATVQAYEVVEQIAGELFCAQSFSKRNANRVTFAVADRDADQTAEQIDYAWSGTPGDSLYRQYNGGTTVELLPNVYEFTLSYDLTLVSVGDTGDGQGDMILIRHEDTGGSLTTVSVKSDRWRAQYFLPSLPGDAVSWAVTRVQFIAKRNGPANGNTLVQIRTADANEKPTDTVLDQRSMPESALPASFEWQEFFFVGVGGIDPADGLCLVLQHVNGARSCDIVWESGGVDTPDSHALRSTDGGNSWQKYYSDDMLFRIYGTATTSDGLLLPADTYRVDAVRISLQVGNDAATRVQTRVQILNVPGVLGP